MSEEQQYVMEVKSVRNEAVSLFLKLQEDHKLSPQVLRDIENIMGAAYKAGHEIANVIGPAEEWSNASCLGYAIKGARRLKFTEVQITELVGAIRGEFDWVTLGEAEQTYNKSPY